jgi:hypothetical protein
VVLERLEMFVCCGPVRTKIKWSIPLNEHILKMVHTNKRKPNECVRLLYGQFHFGSNQSAVNKQFEPFQYHSVNLGPTVGVPRRTSLKRSGPRVNDYDPDQKLNGLIPTVPINKCFWYRSGPINEHIRYNFTCC